MEGELHMTARVTYGIEMPPYSLEPIVIHNGCEDVEVQGEWLTWFNPNTGRKVYHRIPTGVTKVEVQYE